MVKKLSYKLFNKNTPKRDRLQDDNAYFERAVELMAETNGRTTVYQYEVEISEATLANIRSWYNEKKEALYNFPDDEGQFKRGKVIVLFFGNVFP